LAPEKSCNGCPGCRKLKIKNYLPEVGRYCSVIGFEEQTMWSGPLKNKKATLNLYYSIGEKDTPTASRFVDKHWKWIELLLDKGAVKTIRAEWYVLEMLKKKFLHGSLGFWIGIDINQKVDDNASWPEMVLLMPDAKNIPRFLNELNSSPRLLIAPDHIVSTDNSGRRWWEVQPNTNSLKHFIAGSF
jgi:ATP-dependent DNA helicase RecQ